jgi:dTDP-4-dehydrorhamnose reductase
MLGHQVAQRLSVDHEVRITLRRGFDAYTLPSNYDERNVYSRIDVLDPRRLIQVVADFEPDVTVNAIGLVKQRDQASDIVQSIEVNALFPHRLAAILQSAAARLVHLSTDCAFSGQRGNYIEEDIPDPKDTYGRTKVLGEVSGPGCITIRSSIIGLELQTHQGLVEWALAQRGTILGYRRALYSGLTTAEMSRVIELVIAQHPELEGVWHVASVPITKYDLLRSLLEKVGRTDVVVAPDDDFYCDRTLNGSAFEEATGYRAPRWDDMIDDLAKEVRRRETGTK